MKKFIKLAGMALAGTFLALSCACSGGSGGKREVKFEFLKAGFGTEGYQALADAYMDEHPEVKIKLVPNVNVNSTTSTKLESGKNLSDVYIVTSLADIRRWAVKGWVEDITDVYETPVNGEATLKDSCEGAAQTAGEYNGKYYSVPEYISINGFVYNAGMFEQYGWEIPKTTKDLQTLCERIISDTKGTVSPFVYCGKSAQGYLEYMLNAWWAQYEGKDNLDAFYSFSSPEVFNPEKSLGKKYSMQKLYDFFFGNNGRYCMNGCMNKDHMDAQTDFLQGKAAMVPNGSWFAMEMQELLVDLPDFRLGMFYPPTLSDEAGNAIRADYEDENGKPIAMAEIGASYFIPAAAANKEDAKDFLLFCQRYSSCELVTQKNNMVRPLKYNKDPSSATYSNLSEFGKSILSIGNDYFIYTPNSKAAIALSGLIAVWPQGGAWTVKMYENPERYTADYCLESDYEYVKSNWDYWMKNI